MMSLTTPLLCNGMFMKEERVQNRYLGVFSSKSRHTTTPEDFRSMKVDKKTFRQKEMKICKS